MHKIHEKNCCLLIENYKGTIFWMAKKLEATCEIFFTGNKHFFHLFYFVLKKYKKVEKSDWENFNNFSTDWFFP